MVIKPNDPAFAAYTRLTLFANFQKNMKGGTHFQNEKEKDISFKQFKQLLDDNKVVDKDNPKQMSSFHRQALQTQLQYGKDRQFTTEVTDIMNKAFQLGLVDDDQTLINSLDKKA
ncbi:hypothetical protein GCM10011391_19600 [Pullulanibacillus camelliae]|uniref:Uncharacterized protein n=1 Tax=Pullulanibacillus camelliae TaxID=1707096 RepID=A0A8J2YH57_9BACL|nr:hypothetical protein [Pullulanibacillus camelliae]GGE40933.1 hypothetical protein GCM10011391_19600 [Pullulanibacillus camelliae]